MPPFSDKERVQLALLFELRWARAHEEQRTKLLEAMNRGADYGEIIPLLAAPVAVLVNGLPPDYERLTGESVAPINGALRPPAQRQLSEYASPAPTSGKLAGILAKVASTTEGNRQGIGYWAANRLLEAGYGPAAWDALEQAVRSTGADDHDVRTALRDRPGPS